MRQRETFYRGSLVNPASLNDYLVFTTSDIHSRLEQEGFLAPDVCIFGDNAYVNTSYMATPFKSVRSGTKDAYNFYHSQVRINIECAFGMLVNRWAILRRALPAAMTMKKQTALVVTLCRLHNFCINQLLEEGEYRDDEEPLQSLASDEFEIEINGSIPLERTADNNCSPEQLLHGGEHQDDTDRNVRRQEELSHSRRQQLPRDKLHKIVADAGLKRPTPVAWQKTS